MAEAPPSSPPTAVISSASDFSISQHDKKATRALLWALKPLSNLRRPVPLPSLTAFLMVVLDEGRGVNEYARAVGIHRAAMSRNLHAIGGRARNGGPGLGLVTVQPHPTHPIRSQVFLTPKGRSIAKGIFRQLRKATAAHE
jgi:DNA-binding HxlR family transcriptional regulator